MSAVMYNVGSVERACALAIVLAARFDVDFAVRRHLLDVTIRRDDARFAALAELVAEYCGVEIWNQVSP